MSYLMRGASENTTDEQYDKTYVLSLMIVAALDKIRIVGEAHTKE